MKKKTIKTLSVITALLGLVFGGVGEGKAEVKTRTVQSTETIRAPEGGVINIPDNISLDATDVHSLDKVATVDLQESVVTTSTHR